ncbi:MAG TPA: bifunctional DNA primase/polymerase, partial [Isosphaeraceae bacterium]|nr:bifunctional DNA primase/polymerase [Isosphaeraceae bacterium]
MPTNKRKLSAAPPVAPTIDSLTATDPSCPLDAALALLAAGYWPVGIRPDAKGAIGTEWGLRRQTESSLRRLYRRYPRAGVGLVLGPAKAPGGVWLVDIELDGPKGETSLLTLLGGEIVETRGWTSRRGVHRLFLVDGERLLPTLRRCDPHGKRGKGVLKDARLPDLPDLEFRAGTPEKQVSSVCPPTVGDDGQPRRWMGPETLAPLPESAYEFLADQVERYLSARTRPAPAPPRAVIPGRGDRIERYARKALETVLGRLSVASEGNRNDSLNAGAYGLGQLIGAGALDRGEVESHLTSVARQIGLEDTEILPTITSGLTAGIQQPRDLSHVELRSRSPRTETRASQPLVNGNGHHEPPRTLVPTSLPPPEREDVEITTRQHEVVEQVLSLLPRHPDLFRRGASLVKVVTEPNPTVSLGGVAITRVE